MVKQLFLENDLHNVWQINARFYHIESFMCTNTKATSSYEKQANIVLCDIIKGEIISNRDFPLRSFAFYKTWAWFLCECRRVEIASLSSHICV